MGLTVKENYQKVLNGEWGEWVPVSLADCTWVIPSFYMAFMATPERRDMFGVPWAVNSSGPMPDTTQPPVLQDMADWKSVVNLPDLDAVNWEEMAKNDLGAVEPDHPYLLFTCAGSAGNYFLPLMAMLGFENGLLSFYDSPDDVKEFFACMTDYYLRVIDLEEKYYNPEVYCLADDIASAASTFISMDVYREFLKPHYQQLIGRIKSYGKKVEFHLCGKAEPIVEDLVEMGVDIWQSGQAMNDLEGLQEKFGSKLVINGGWDSTGPENLAGADEETCRQAARKAIDRLVGLGPSMLFALVLGSGPEIEQQNAWIMDEAYSYGRQVLAKQVGAA